MNFNCFSKFSRDRVDPKNKSLLNYYNKNQLHVLVGWYGGLSWLMDEVLECLSAVVGVFGGLQVEICCRLNTQDPIRSKM